MTKKELVAIVEELRAANRTLLEMVQTLLAQKNNPIYVGPLPVQPTIAPTPYIPPFPTPYIGDPPYLWGPTTICGPILNEGTISSITGRPLCINSTRALGGESLGVQGSSQCHSASS